MLKLDLKTGYPRSVRDKVLGVFQLGRAIDKGIATANGTEGEYHYNCPMDKDLFGFLGIDAEALMSTIKKANSQDEIVAYVKPFVDKKSPADITAFNEKFLQHAPKAGTDAEKYFHETLNRIAPKRTDVKTWPDLLDLEEGRNVPEHAHA
jgi:hypothetical protein